METHTLEVNIEVRKKKISQEKITIKAYYS